jgi:mono/diheme cytochrome c family protein
LRYTPIIVMFLVAANPVAAPGSAKSPLEEGRALAEANCARCHNLEEAGESPYAPAPPFRDIAKMYKATDLEEALVEGIVVGHPAMPEFEMTGEQAAAVAAFIDSLGH